MAITRRAFAGLLGRDGFDVSLFGLAVGIAAVIVWSFSIYAARPSACFHRALADIDADKVEPLQYELLTMRGSAAYEPHAYLIAGKLILAEGRPDAALESLALATDHLQTQSRALVLSGEALYRMGRFLEAGDCWMRALKVDPNNVDALRWLGVAYSDLGANTEARYYLERAAELAPHDASALRLDALIAKESGAFQAAIDAFNESLRRDPQQADADLIRFEIAECYYSLGEDVNAVRILQGCPATAEALTLKAHALSRLGRGDEALEACRQALQADPRQVKALLLEAKIATERKEPERSLEALQHAIAAQPKCMEAHYQLAALWRRLGEDEKSAQAAQIAADLSRDLEAYQSLKERAARDPRDVEARMRLGRLASNLDMTAEAMTWFRSALYLEPGQPEARQELRKLLQEGHPRH